MRTRFSFTCREGTATQGVLEREPRRPGAQRVALAAAGARAAAPSRAAPASRRGAPATCACSNQTPPPGGIQRPCRRSCRHETREGDAGRPGGRSGTAGANRGRRKALPRGLARASHPYCRHGSTTTETSLQTRVQDGHPCLRSRVLAHKQLGHRRDLGQVGLHALPRVDQAAHRLQPGGSGARSRRRRLLSGCSLPAQGWRGALGKPCFPRPRRLPLLPLLQLRLLHASPAAACSECPTQFVPTSTMSFGISRLLASRSARTAARDNSGRVGARGGAGGGHRRRRHADPCCRRTLQALQRAKRVRVQRPPAISSRYSSRISKACSMLCSRITASTLAQQGSRRNSLLQPVQSQRRAPQSAQGRITAQLRGRRGAPDARVALLVVPQQFSHLLAQPLHLRQQSRRREGLVLPAAQVRPPGPVAGSSGRRWLPHRDLLLVPQQLDAPHAQAALRLAARMAEEQGWLGCRRQSSGSGRGGAAGGGAALGPLQARHRNGSARGRLCACRAPQGAARPATRRCGQRNRFGAAISDARTHHLDGLKPNSCISPSA